jgi:acyl-homoserine lactone synthase
MLHIIKGFDPTKKDILDHAFRFRYHAFVEEAGWHNLRREDKREIDQFDTQDTIHIVVMKNNTVQAYSRLNPTLKPHILSEVYPEMASRGLVREETAWEWSRMGTAKSARSDGRGWGGPIGLLIRCVSLAALKNGIETLVWQAHPVWITRASELGFDPHPLGLPLRIDGERVLAAKMAVMPSVLTKMDDVGITAVQFAE